MKERILLAKRKNTSNSASKSGMFFHFAVKFELFKEFCCIHKNYVVFFNLIPFDVWFVLSLCTFSLKSALGYFDLQSDCITNRHFVFLLTESLDPSCLRYSVLNVCGNHQTLLRRCF